MSQHSGDDSGRAWQLVFIQPSTPGDNHCVMLYGLNGEVVGPMTVELAEAWMDRFDYTKIEREQQHSADTTWRLPD